jgi:hypothetical protein
MSRFLGAKDRDAWARERSRGLARFLWSKAWPAGIGFAVGNALMPLIRADRHFDWQESALWFGWGLVGGSFWAAVTWWNRERAFRHSAEGRGGAAA